MTKDVTGRDAGAEPGIRQTIQCVRMNVAAETGLAQGTRVLTLDGALPVEYLSPSDRVVTRGGMRLLRAVQVTQARGPLLRVAAGTLGHDRPEKPLLVGARAQVLLRGWRAQAMFGQREALVGLARLVDGVNVCRVAGEGRRLFTLHFDMAEVLYAEGVEIGARVASVKV
ncbi:MAG: Hint domain-containing protein [Sphingomonadales bacterium]|nr:Hint domain-containing protein [Sphingomonadales bacterium]